MTNPSNSWRIKPPEIALTEQLSFHQGEGIPLDVGRIQGFYDDRQPFIQIDLLIPAGTWFESQYGAAQMMVSLLKSGTSNHSGEALNALIEETGGNIAIQRGTYYIHVIVQGLNHSIEILLDLLFDMLSESIFDESELSKRV
ncbi:MAG: insulinase family protein, partial [Bacteroidota bacterium]|nr:insulinase family protein [Bacteroidota bacterium]